MKKRKSRLGLIVLLAIVVIGIGAGAYFILNPDSGRMKSGTIQSTLKATAVVIRQENVVSRGDAYQVHFLIDEGSYVQSNQPICNVFERGYGEYMSQLITLEQDIFRQQQLLMQQQGIAVEASPELVGLINNIDSAIAQLQSVSKGNSNADYIDLMDQLAGLMESRRQLLESIVAPNEDLINSINSLRQLQSSATQKSTLVNFGSEGYISFNVDGYEAALNPNQLNTTQVANVISSNGLVSKSAADLYKVISPNLWYLAFNVANDSPERLIEGQPYQITIEGIDTVYDAYCIRAQSYSTSAMFVLEINADVAPVLNRRTCSITIPREAIGVMVPNEAIVYTEGAPSIMVKQGDAYINVPIYILNSNEDECIILAQDSSIQLREGLRYKMP